MMLENQQDQQESSHHRNPADEVDPRTAPGPDWMSMGDVGPRIRTNMVTVYILRRPNPDDVTGTQFLQMRRTFSRGSFMNGTWQPVTGGIEPGESAVAAAFREVEEETGLNRETVMMMWHVDQVRPFYLPSKNLILFPASFAIQVAADWEPVLNEEHDAVRWIRYDEVNMNFMWRGQRDAIRDIAEDVLASGPIGSEHLVVTPEIISRADEAVR
ncbi:MAG: NUDIX domain-containing protein [Planctomycetota bacterium]